jgi:hypothetical protein
MFDQWTFLPNLLFAAKPKTTESIIAPWTKVLNELASHAERQHAKAETHQAKAIEHAERGEKARADAAKAIVLETKLSDVFKV